MLILCLFGLIGLVRAEGVMFKINAHEEKCFYSVAKHRNEKIAVYYAVQTGDGKNFNIEMDAMNPKGDVIMSSRQEPSGDYVFSATSPGEYSFCFINHESAQKMIFIDLMAESDTYLSDGTLGSEAVKKPGASNSPTNSAQKSKVDQLVISLNSKMDVLTKQQLYIKTRENRNISTGMQHKDLYHQSYLQILEYSGLLFLNHYY